MGGIFTSLPAILISPGQDLIATLGLGGSALRGRYCNVPLRHAPVPDHGEHSSGFPAPPNHFSGQIPDAITVLVTTLFFFPN